MLYGHIEEPRQRVDHMLRLRELQDETGGFMSFIPLAFHPENTRWRSARSAARYDRLRRPANVAVARLMLDNFDAYQGVLDHDVAGHRAGRRCPSGRTTSTARSKEEKIVHMAGATTPMGLPLDEIVRLVKRAGKTPVRRDTLYNVLEAY